MAGIKNFEKAEVVTLKEQIDYQKGIVGAALETQNNPYLGGDSTLSCSPQTAATIDDMVVETVREGYDTAMDLLEKNKMKLHELAKYLYEKETITGEEFMQILNRKEISGEQIKTESED